MTFSNTLIESRKEDLDDIAKHKIFMSLAGLDEEALPENQLIQARNNFYIQDYFYLVYGYKVPQLFLIDCSENNYLKQRILWSNDDVSYDKSLHNPFLLEENPFKSSKSIRTIRNIIDTVNNIQIEGSYPNLATQEYIFFKTSTAFQGDAQAIVSNLPCLYVYNKFTTEIFPRNSGGENRSKYYKNPNFKKWINFLAASENSNYFQTGTQILGELTENASPDLLKELAEIFIRACDLEKKFVELLLPLEDISSDNIGRDVVTSCD